MKKILLLLAIPGALLVAGVLKTQFTENGFFITASSKITGNGSSFTVCEYFDANTGEFISQQQFPNTGFTNESDLQQFCIGNEPSQ